MTHDTLNDLLRNLEIIEAKLDDTDDLTEEQIKAHFDAVEAVDQKVDRLLGYMDQCKMYADLHKERAATFEAQSEAWKRRYKNLEKYALSLLKAYPDVEWRGKDRTISKRQNPGSLACPVKMSKSYSNAIDPEYVLLIPHEYRSLEPVWVLNTERIKSELKKGNQLAFAHLVQSESLVIKVRKDPKNDSSDE